MSEPRRWTNHPKRKLQMADPNEIIRLKDEGWNREDIQNLLECPRKQIFEVLGPKRRYPSRQKLSDEDLTAAKEMLKNGMTKMDVAKQFNVTWSGLNGALAAFDSRMKYSIDCLKKLTAEDEKAKEDAIMPEAEPIPVARPVQTEPASANGLKVVFENMKICGNHANYTLHSESGSILVETPFGGAKTGAGDLFFVEVGDFENFVNEAVMALKVLKGEK